MNDTFKNAGLNILKDLLSKCTQDQQLIFKRMYSPRNIELTIEEVVDKMKPERISWAITQCETTVENNKSIQQFKEL